MEILSSNNTDIQSHCYNNIDNVHNEHIIDDETNIQFNEQVIEEANEEANEEVNDDINDDIKKEELIIANNILNLNLTNRKNRYYMSSFELARIIGVRATQISNGFPTKVKNPYLTNPLDIAKEELKQSQIPLIIRRYNTDNSYEDWLVNELIY